MNTALLTVDRFLRLVTRKRCALFRYMIVAQPVPDTALAPTKRARSIRIERLEPGDPLLEHFPRPSHVYSDRFAQGAIAYGAFIKDKAAGFIWFTVGPYEEDEVNCQFYPKPYGRTAWDFDVYVAPEYRFTRTFAILWDAAYSHMRSIGVKYTLSRISSFNPSSIMAHRRIGAASLGTITFLRLGNLQFATGAFPPRYHFSASQVRRPCYEVDVTTAMPTLDANC